MKTSHFHALLIVLILAFAGLGYWSYSVITIDFDTPAPVVTPVLEKPENTPEPTPTEQSGQVSSVETAPATPVVEKDKTVSVKYKNLAQRLENLVKDNITMKATSKGTRVGTIEEFIGVYTGKKVQIKGLYSKDLETAVSAFQTKTGITSTGFGDPVTYQKMIDFLKTTE